MVVNLPGLFGEIEKHKEKVKHWKTQLKISARAHLVFNFHQDVDGLQEKEKEEANKKLGTTKKGIGPAYASKANRNGIRVADLVGDFDLFSAKYVLNQMMMIGVN